MPKAIEVLLDIMARLRSPGGCPWDREQTFKSIAPSAIEEAYELAEAIESGDTAALREELGDLLLQVVFHAQMASEQGMFDFNDVASGLAEKLIERHPHVFGGDPPLDTGAEVRDQWENGKIAKRSREARTSGKKAPGLLEGISATLPSSTRALKISQRLASVGFDWQAARDVMAKFHEESTELEKEIEEDASKEAIENELGDVMFALVNLARHLGIDPEAALRKCNRKVERRWRGIEERLASEGKAPQQCTPEELEELWREVKKGEPGPTGNH